MKLILKRLALVVVLLGISVTALGQQTTGFIWRQPEFMDNRNFTTYQYPLTQTFGDSFLNSFAIGSQIRKNKELLKMEQESAGLSQELMRLEIERQNKEIEKLRQIQTPVSAEMTSAQIMKLLSYSFTPYQTDLLNKWMSLQK
jgi:hypothetical protein